MNVFKKITIELWVLLLVAILLLIFLMGFGALVIHKIAAPINKFPAMSGVAYFISKTPSNFRDILKGKNFKDLQIKEDRFPSLAGFQGDPLDQEVYLLLSKYDGDLDRSTVELVDLRSFEIKKIWRPNMKKINMLVDTTLPEFKNIHRDKNANRYNIKHPFLTNDGGLIFQDDSPLVKIDKNSQLVWQNQEDIFHHSIEQDHEGNLWIPSTIYPYQIDKKYVSEEYGFKDDAVTKVSTDGEILFQKSVSNILIENNLGYLLFPIMDYFTKDPIHLNDIQPVLNDGPHWKQGDLFLSLRSLSLIMLYRPSTNEIIWKRFGLTNAQHDIDILDNHRISIFNNNAYLFYNGRKVDGNNEIIIYDFNLDASSKYLDSSIKQQDVKTSNQGLNKILATGDLFIEEQNSGRLLYFNEDGSLKWQYLNRANNGKVYFLNWSRILNKPEDIKKVRNIIN
jgi:hypothetical protein